MHSAVYGGWHTDKGDVEWLQPSWSSPMEVEVEEEEGWERCQGCHMYACILHSSCALLCKRVFSGVTCLHSAGVVGIQSACTRQTVCNRQGGCQVVTAWHCKGFILHRVCDVHPKHMEQKWQIEYMVNTVNRLEILSEKQIMHNFERRLCYLNCSPQHHKDKACENI